jgi:hypothetical protein
VHVARETGQSVREVASESFALTLWTWATVQPIWREESVERMGERTDLAGLVAVAFHEPAKLQQAEMRYLKAAGQLQATIENSRSRAEALITKLADAKPVEAI